MRGNTILTDVVFCCCCCCYCPCLTSTSCIFISRIFLCCIVHRLCCQRCNHCQVFHSSIHIYYSQNQWIIQAINNILHRQMDMGQLHAKKKQLTNKLHVFLLPSWWSVFIPNVLCLCTCRSCKQFKQTSLSLVIIVL